MNHELSWEKQLFELLSKTNRMCAYSTQNTFTLAQQIKSLNSILVPRLTYSLAVIPDHKELRQTLNTINSRIGKALQRKLRTAYGPDLLYGTYRDLGLNMVHLPSIAAAVNLESFTNSLNSIDSDTLRMCRTTYKEEAQGKIKKHGWVDQSLFIVGVNTTI